MLNINESIAFKKALCRNVKSDEIKKLDMYLFIVQEEWKDGLRRREYRGKKKEKIEFVLFVS